MAESTAAFPYETRLNILNGPLELIDVKAVADACEFKWFNQTLCQVNGSVVRVGVFEGEYHWHKHDDDDEFFYVVEGVLLIDLEERGPQRQVFVDGVQSRVVELAPGQGFVVPRGVVHRTRAQQRTVVLMVENAGIIPTGN
jgi:mannose-6-phosphate isomerase-like protein (cupin superfamily)